LKIFSQRSNPPPPWNYYTDWSSSKGQNRDFGKRVCQDPSITVLALRKDVIDCIPGKRRLLTKFWPPFKYF
jgi:hypothetical protein